jgi:hypothetical protein
MPRSANSPSKTATTATCRDTSRFLRMLLIDIGFMPIRRANSFDFSPAFPMWRWSSSYALAVTERWIYLLKPRIERLDFWSSLWVLCFRCSSQDWAFTR